MQSVDSVSVRQASKTSDARLLVHIVMSSSERNDKTDKTDAFHSLEGELGTDYLAR